MVKRMIETIGWVLLMTLVYFVVVSGLVIRQFQADEDERSS